MLLKSTRSYMEQRGVEALPLGWSEHALADGTPSFVPPSLKYTFVFAGQEGAVGCPFPPRLLAEIARTHKRMEPGMSYSAYHFAGPPASKRARTTERVDTASSTTGASTES